jgi:hypothetical protein
MKLFYSIEEMHLKETDCIAISADSGTLRAIAKFIDKAADELDEMGNDSNHLHLMDEWDGWNDGMPDIQIFNNET